jgi:hypothetical protein
MMTVLFTALVLVAPGLIAELLAAARARATHPFDAGFHLRRERVGGTKKFGGRNLD